MLNGKALGDAIGKAIALKLESGALRSKVEVANHFGVRPPAVHDWIRRGTIAKDKLTELWRYFADVAGPEHWGMTRDEWPAGLNGKAATPYPSAAEPNGAQRARQRAEHPVIQRVRALDQNQLAQLETVLDAIEKWHHRTISTPKRKASRFRSFGPDDPQAGNDSTKDQR